MDESRHLPTLPEKRDWSFNRMDNQNEEKKENITETPAPAQAEVKSEEAKSETEDTKPASKDAKPTPKDTKPAPKDAKPAPQTRQSNSAPGARRGQSGRSAPAGSVTKDPTAPEVIEKVISIKRITKVTKGGKKLSFSALVVVGDTMGKAGYSLSKAREVSIAIRKAMTTAKKNMVKIPMKGSSIPHEIIGECSGAEVLLKPASEGTGVIACGPVRAVCDGAGIHNILTKCHRSNNPINVVKATFDGLSRLKTVKK